MKEDILNPEYWKRRLQESPPDCLHQSVFKCDKARWELIEAKHRLILAKHILFADSVLDAGCGWGRLLDLMPSTWGGLYCGMDISPDFIEMARRMHIDRPHAFVCQDMLCLDHVGSKRFDWGVLISIRPMIKRHLGSEHWDKIEVNLKRVCVKLLYLEYDESDEGSIE